MEAATWKFKFTECKLTKQDYRKNPTKLKLIQNCAQKRKSKSSIYFPKIMLVTEIDTTAAQVSRLHWTKGQSSSISTYKNYWFFYEVEKMNKKKIELPVRCGLEESRRRGSQPPAGLLVVRRRLAIAHNLCSCSHLQFATCRKLYSFFLQQTTTDLNGNKIKWRLVRGFKCGLIFYVYIRL